MQSSVRVDLCKLFEVLADIRETIRCCEHSPANVTSHNETFT
jgi:hypothetical protein